jgi:hypothetical protein
MWTEDPWAAFDFQCSGGSPELRAALEMSDAELVILTPPPPGIYQTGLTPQRDQSWIKSAA